MAAGALSIKLRCASWQQLATIYRRDLSKGTMFLKASTPPPLGTAVRIDLTLPSGSVVVLTGAVEQHVDDPHRGAGVALKLAPIDERTTWMIENALAAESKTRTATPASGIPIVKPPRAPTAPPVEMSVNEGEEVSAAEQDLVRALVSEAESLKKLNPFLVLGVGYEATDDDVRAAFGELTKRYHPDRFARYQSTELRSTAAEIFILIRDAYRKLGDEAGRTQALAAFGRSPAPRAVAAPRPASPPPPPPPRMTQRVSSAATPPGGVPIVTPASGGAPPVAVIGAAPRAIVDQKSAPVRVIPSTPGAGRPVEAAPRPMTDHKSGPIRAAVERSMPSAVVDQKSGPVRVVVDNKSGPIRTPAAPTTPMPSASRGTGPTPVVLPPTAKASSSPTSPVPRVGTKPPPPVPRYDTPTSQGNLDTAGGAVDVTAPTETPERASSPQKVIGPITDAADAGQIDELLDLGRVEEAMNAYRLLAKKYPNDRNFRAGIELCEGLNALAARDRLEAAQRFEAALEIDPSNERAARELADMRRQATNERKGLLSRLMGKKEP